MREFLSIALLALAALCAASCATPNPQDARPQEAASPQTYRQAVDALIAATRTQGDYQSTSMQEGREPCTFGFYISPGRQSTVGFLFDVRKLNLNDISAAQGQVTNSPFSRRIACAIQHGNCASNTGMPVPFVDIAAPNAEEMDRALGALRQIQAVCLKQPPAP